MDIDQRPEEATWRVYAGDPVNLRVHVVKADGSPAPVEGWVWAAWAGTSPPTPFECYAEDDGVTLYLRGSDSDLLVGAWWPFDVTGRDPAAGEGTTVLRGQVCASPRVTPALRGAVGATA